MKLTKCELCADHLLTAEDAALYLAACLDDDPGDGSLVRAALGDIARARSMTKPDQGRPVPRAERGRQP